MSRGSTSSNHKLAPKSNNAHEEVLEQLLDFFFDFWDGIVCGTESSHRLALLIDNELGKVPFDGINHESTLFVFQIGEKGMLILAVNINLLKHIKFYIEFGHEILDVLSRTRFLASKLVAGEGQDAQTTSAFIRVFFIHLGELLVVYASLASFRRDIDHDTHMVFVLGQIHQVAINVICLEDKDVRSLFGVCDRSIHER